MSQNIANERLASVEAKLEFMKELLQEIRSDIRDLPTREEYEKLEDRVEELEAAKTSIAIKVGIAAGTLSILIGIAMRLL